ncbi:hypothetical protein MASR1M32_23990 [Rhodobacter sp.]
MKVRTDLTVTGRPLRPRSGVPQPAMRMDFVNGSYHPGGLGGTLLFARASTARHFDATGSMVQVANDVPRLDFDPQTRKPRGLLVEGTRTNLLVQSATSAGWGVLNAAMAASAVAAPIAGQTMIALTEDGSNGAHQSVRSVVLAAGSHAFQPSSGPMRGRGWRLS